MDLAELKKAADERETKLAKSSEERINQLNLEMSDLQAEKESLEREQARISCLSQEKEAETEELAARVGQHLARCRFYETVSDKIFGQSFRTKFSDKIFGLIFGQNFRTKFSVKIFGQNLKAVDQSFKILFYGPLVLHCNFLLIHKSTPGSPSWRARLPNWSLKIRM
jgi:hypothetical protein